MYVTMSEGEENYCLFLFKMKTEQWWKAFLRSSFTYSFEETERSPFRKKIVYRCRKRNMMWFSLCMQLVLPLQLFEQQKQYSPSCLRSGEKPMLAGGNSLFSLFFLLQIVLSYHHYQLYGITATATHSLYYLVYITFLKGTPLLLSSYPTFNCCSNICSIHTATLASSSLCVATFLYGIKKTDERTTAPN